MSSGNSISSSDISLCIVCGQPAVGVGPFTGDPMCNDHLVLDKEAVNKLKENVKERLRPYSEGGIALAFNEELLVLQQKLQEMEQRFEQLRQQFRSRVVEHLNAGLEAVQNCIEECSDIHSYDSEVQEATGCGNVLLVRDLAVGMQAHVGEIEAAFSRAARLRDESKAIDLYVDRRLDKLQRMLSEELGGSGSAEIGVSAPPQPERGAIALSHELKLDSIVTHVTVCTYSGDFRSDRSDRVVPAKAAREGSAALPQPCLVARVRGKDYLTVLSLDGKVRLRTHCEDLNLDDDPGEPDFICGLHSHHQLLFILQESELTVTDLSGRKVRRILRQLVGFDSFWGICGNVASVFVSSRNKIAVFSKASGQLETVITLQRIPDAILHGMTIQQPFILVIDDKHNKVYRVRIDTQEVVATYPTQLTGLEKFNGPAGVAVDSRGRTYVSDFRDHSVRVLAADDDGSLVSTLGVPGNKGRDDDRLSHPFGLAVVTVGPCEQLVVADCKNERLLVFNLH